jgi:hypothetical protein
MTIIEIGKEYKLSRHPSTPIGKVMEHNTIMQEVTIKWNDSALIPPTQKYSEWEFLSCFEPAVGGTYYGQATGGNLNCFHDWKRFNGFREDYDYCTKCDRKRFLE